MLNYDRILVPVDFSDISTSALEQATRHSEASESKLFVAHIIDQKSVTTDEARNAVKRDAVQQLDNLLDSAEVGYCEKVVEIGETVPMLLQLVNDNNIDLVVMGTHHFSELDNGYSVTKALGEKLVCDILMLHK